MRLNFVYERSFVFMRGGHTEVARPSTATVLNLLKFVGTRRIPPSRAEVLLQTFQALKTSLKLVQS